MDREVSLIFQIFSIFFESCLGYLHGSVIDAAYQVGESTLESADDARRPVCTLRCGDPLRESIQGFLALVTVASVLLFCQRI